MNKLYGVVFQENEKKYYYTSEIDFFINDLVIVNTERGEQLVKIVQIINKENSMADGQILRKATNEDYNNFMNNLKDGNIAYKKCKELIKEQGLDMNLVNASYNLDRSQLLFNFTAESRVDFRDLAKKLAGLYHTRIELRQIGARDKAKEIGGIGICGGKLCCARFLRGMNSISINMAKDQNIALNPNKINGSCGRLLCCLQYEDETYLECMKELPSLGDIIKIPEGEGPVVSIDILNHKVKVLIDGEKVDYVITNANKK